MWFFFFQAEDGIRDLVRSRGLGDVYKRQLLDGGVHDVLHGAVVPEVDDFGAGGLEDAAHDVAVSYTHLTLPTSDLV